MRSQSSYAAFLWASSSSPFSSSSSSSSSPHFIFLLPPPFSSICRSSKDPHCFGIQTVNSWNGLCLATLLDTEVTNPMEYEFNFQLEIRGPCLLAGERALPRPKETKKTKGDGVSDPKPPERLGDKKSQRSPIPDRSQN